MAAKYKLTYFNLRGIVEPVRYMFAYKDRPYEDIRIEQEQWPALKAKQPFGKLPVLEVDGHVVTESLAIMRFIARELDLDGKTNLDSAMADMVMDSIQECVEAIRTFARREKNEEKKESLKKLFFDETVPVCFKGIERVLKNNGGQFFVGDDLTWVDFGVAHFVELIQGFNEEVLQDYPFLDAHLKQVKSLPAISDWIEKRPKTDL